MSKFSLDEYQQAITDQFPALAIHSVSIFSEGWANQLCLVNDTLIFRFPLDAHAEQQLLLEIQLLPVLAPELPLAIPSYQYIATERYIYPYLFVGYPLIPGTSYQRAPDALREATWWRSDVGIFLTALHRVPTAKVINTGLQGCLTAQAWCDAVTANHEPYKRHIFPLLTLSQRQSISQYLREAVRDEQMVSFTPTIIHQDFDFHNFLVDVEAQHVTGVVDFGCCAIGDPAVDVSPAIRPYYDGKIDRGWDFRRDYYRRTSALEDLLYICTSEHELPNSEVVKHRKLDEIAQIWGP